MNYLCIYNNEAGDYTAIVPDFDSQILVWGKTPDDALRLASEALALYFVETQSSPNPQYAKLQDVPASVYRHFDYPIATTIAPAAMNPVSLEIEQMIERSGLTQTEISQRMGTSGAALSRLKNPFYWGHSLETLRKLAHATGQQLEVKFKSRPKSASAYARV